MGDSLNQSPAYSIKINFKQWQNFQNEYTSQKVLRMGQMFCNKFGVQDDSVLFYENDSDATKTIWEHYVSPQGISTTIRCLKCGSVTKQDKALLNSLVTSPDFIGDTGNERGCTQSRRGSARLVDCCKCVQCGHSFIPE